MCQKRSSVEGSVFIKETKRMKTIRVDECIRHLPNSLSFHGYNVVSSCCGHGKYPLTIICRTNKGNKYFELISGVDIPRMRRFYKKDKEGFYYIPEVVEHARKIA